LSNARSWASEASRRRDLAKRRTIDVCGPVENCGLREFRMIQDIEVFHSKFQTDALSDGRCLGQSGVHICQMRSSRDEPVEVQITGYGPSSTEYVDPALDPRSRKSN
jgi:hypothetical protein